MNECGYPHGYGVFVTDSDCRYEGEWRDGERAEE